MDLVLEVRRERWAFEVKLTSSPGPEDMESLNRAADMNGATWRFLVTRTSKPAGDQRRASCNLPWLLDRLHRLIYANLHED